MNFSITINGEGAELNIALKTLKSVLGENIGEGSVTASIQPQAAVAPVAPPVAPPIQTTTPGQAAQAYQQQQDYANQAQQYQQTQAQHQPPAYQQTQPPVQPPAGTVPTSAPTYSLDQLGVACGPLVDAGRQQDLLTWLNQHGAAALTQLDKAYYGEFATFIRSLGARI